MSPKFGSLYFYNKIHEEELLATISNRRKHVLKKRDFSLLNCNRSLTRPFFFSKTLYELVRKNSNHIWESALNNSSDGKLVNVLFKNMKKPTPKDSR